MGKARDSATVVAEAKNAIEDAFADLAIFRRQRGQALHHYFAVLEVEQFKAGGDPISESRRASFGTRIDLPGHSRHHATLPACRRWRDSN